MQSLTLNESIVLVFRCFFFKQEINLLCHLSNLVFVLQFQVRSSYRNIKMISAGILEILHYENVTICIQESKLLTHL